MDYHQPNGDDDYSTLTYSQNINSLSLTSSITSTSDSTSKTTNSSMIPKKTNITVDRSMTRTRSLRKQHYQQQKQMEHHISSQSINTTTSILPSNTRITKQNEKQEKSLIHKREARPLGTCVRKCDQCQQLKHILLTECTVCFRMIDVDLKDCKCQMLQNRNIIDHFICSICNSELTLDGYIICANRTCQTTLSALLHKENLDETQEKSIFSALHTNICYPKSGHRTIAIQVNTLINLPPLTRFLSTIIDDETKESLLFSKRDLDWTIITASDSSDTSHMSVNSGADASHNNMATAFNSNQPTKLALQSEDELQQKPSPTSNLTNTIVNNTLEYLNMPKSPRCLAIMNVRKHHDRLSTLLKLQTNKICQTQLSCLINMNKMIKCEEISNIAIIQTNYPSKIERQIQVDTIQGHFDDLCQVQIEITDSIEKDTIINTTNDERILQALTDRDGQRWSELIDQLINEQPHFSPSEIAQQLLDTIERLHTSEKLNNLTTGQLQRKVRYAMSQFKHIDEHSYLQNNLKTIKTNRSRINSKRNTDCNGRIDLAVTVRQIDKHHHHHQSIVSTDQNWKPYVDRLFDQGHSANEIQRLLREAAETTMQSDDQRLQNVFNYINTKAKQQIPSTGISFITTSTKTKPVTCPQFQSIKSNETMLNSREIMARPLSSISQRKVTSNKSSPVFNNKDQDSTMEETKNKSSLPNVLLSKSLIKSSIIESDIIQVKSSKNTSIIDLNNDEKERNLSLHSSADQKNADKMTDSSITTMFKQQSITSTDIAIGRERSNDNVTATLQQRPKQIQELAEPKPSQANETSSVHNSKNSSTIDITPSHNSIDISSTGLEEKCIRALHHVQNTLDTIDDANIRFHPHPSNLKIELNKLIDILESNVSKPDSIESLMTQCVKLLNNEKKAILPQLEEIHFQNLNKQLSDALTLLQEYKKIAIPILKNTDDFSFNQHISNMVTVPSDALAPLKPIEENIEQTIESQSQPVQLSYQAITSPIRCRPIPYMSPNVTRSIETLNQVLICPIQHISLKTKEQNEPLIVNKNDLSDVLDIPLKTEDELYDHQSQRQWLNSLLSKISDNVSSTSSISSLSSSLLLIDPTKIDRNGKEQDDQQESIIMDMVDKKTSSLSNDLKSSASIHQYTTDYKQNTLYETDVIILEEEHIMPIIAPDQVFSMLDEQYQVVQTKLLVKQVSNSDDQLKSSQVEKNIIEEPSNSNIDSNHTSQKSHSITTLHENKFDTEEQSDSSIVNDESQLSSSDDVDLSDQLEQFQIYQNTTSSKQLIPENALINDEKRSSILIPDDTGLSKTDTNTVPETNTQLSLLNDHEEKKTTPSVSLFPSDENEDQNLMKTNEPHIHIEKPRSSSHTNIQVSVEHASIATSKMINEQNVINKLQLPVSTQYLSISYAIQSNSFLIHLNNQNDSVPSEETVSTDNSVLIVQKRSSTDSEYQNVVATPIQNDEDIIRQVDNTSTDEFYTPSVMSPNHSIVQQSPNTIISPSEATKFEDVQYQKLAIPSSFPFLPTSSPTVEDELIDRHQSVPHLLIEEPSGSATPLIGTVIANDDDENSLRSMSSTHDLLIDDIPKEDLRNKLNHNSDELQNEHNSSIISNTSTLESSSFDDTARTPPPSLRSKQNLITDTMDDQQSSIQLTINKRFSRPKIEIEDIQSPIISTPHSSLVSISSNDNVHNKLRHKLEKDAQFISEDTQSSNVSSSTTSDEKLQPNKMPVDSFIKLTSSSNENTSNITPENTEENSNIYSTSQLEQNQDEEQQSEKTNSLKSETLINQSPSLADKQLMMDDFNKTKDILDPIRPSFLAEFEDNNNDRLDDKKSAYIEQHHSPMTFNSDAKQVDSSSLVIGKRRSIPSPTITSVLPSSITNVSREEKDLRPRISSPSNKNRKSTIDNTLAMTSKETQRPISVSSSNPVHLTDVNFDNHHETESEIRRSQLGKSSFTNSLTHDSMPSYSMPKLLLKRSSIKPTSITAQSIKPNATVSITDFSTSSSNTVVTDHHLSTHSTITDQEEIISLKKVKKRNSSKNVFMPTQEIVSKRNILKKTLRPSQNQSFISTSQKEQNVKTSTKKFTNNSLLTNSELIYDTEPGSDAWMKSHEDISEILIINEQDEKKSQIHKRQQKKQNKIRMIDGSRLLNLKARGDHQAYTIDSSRLPSIEQSCGENHIKKYSNVSSHRPIIRFPVTQIEKFQCGTIGPRLIHSSSIARQLLYLPSIHNHHISSELNQTTDSFTDRFYSLMSSETNNDDKQAFESILNCQQHQIQKTEQNKFQYMYLLDTSTKNSSIRGKQYPILTDEIDMIDDPNACTIVNKWAFADLVNAEREKFLQKSSDNNIKKSNLHKNIKICLYKRPLTQFEQNIFKEVDIISIIDSQTIYLHIPSITVDNQVFIKNRKFKCDQTFNEHSQINTIYHSTLAPLLDISIDGNKCLCLIGGGKYSGKTSLLRSLVDLFSFDLIRLLSTYDIYIKLLGICHNRIIDLLQNNSPIRIIKSINLTLIPNDEFYLENDHDIDYITCLIKKRRRFIHQLIEINFRKNSQSNILGSLMIVMLASSQYVYTKNLCSHRKKFLINSLNRTILSFKRALIGIRQNPDKIRAAFNNDILTRLIQPYVFHNQSNICYIGTLNPGHRHRTATKSTLEFARNLRFCLKRINRQRRKKRKIISNK